MKYVSQVVMNAQALSNRRQGVEKHPVGAIRE